MIINKETKSSEHVKFVEYTGRYPNLCRGVLTLNIDGKDYTFGHDYTENKSADYESFWCSGGSCGFTNNYSESYINSGDWCINYEELPEEFKKYAEEIDSVFNSNVPMGCCGGCL